MTVNNNVRQCYQVQIYSTFVEMLLRVNLTFILHVSSEKYQERSQMQTNICLYSGVRPLYLIQSNVKTGNQFPPHICSMGNEVYRNEMKCRNANFHALNKLKSQS